ncbi:mucin-associated surface protein (MASP), putative, partial [Trypanosoma cruzi marinkellei]
MVTMMTGRVLLVCALCVLWCGAGCLYARDLDSKALGDCMPSGVLGVNASHVPNGCNKYMPTPPLRSALPISAIQAEDEQSIKTSHPGDNLPSGTASGAGSGGGSEDKGDLAVPGIGAPPGVGVVPGAIPGAAKPADSAGVFTDGAAGAPRDAPVPTASAISAGQQPQNSALQNGQTHCEGKASECGGQQSSGSPTVENQDLEAPNKGEPQVTQHTNPKPNDENSTEGLTTELESTKPQHEIKPPVNENGSTSTDASTVVAANSTSASSQEEATESSSNGSHSSP